MARLWRERFSSTKPTQVVVLQNAFGRYPPGTKMLVPSLTLVKRYMMCVPEGKTITLRKMMHELAKHYDAHLTCPLTTALYVRVIGEIALEEMREGLTSNDVTPFWRLEDEGMEISAKYSCGLAFIQRQRESESPVHDEHACYIDS